MAKKIYYVRSKDFDSFFETMDQALQFIKKEEYKQFKIFTFDAEDVTDQFYGKED